MKMISGERFSNLLDFLFRRKSATSETRLQSIIIDGVIFQLQNKSGGISVVWLNYLKRLSKSQLAGSIIVLDRKKTAPRFDGIKYKNAKKYKGKSQSTRLEDSVYLEQMCREENASMMISTYYTYAERTKTVVMLYDFIPERLGWDLNTTEWQSKGEAINKAYAYISISTNTLNDFSYYYPQLADRSAKVIYIAANEYFRPHSLQEINHFYNKYKIVKPYYLVVGHRWPHKNSILFFKAAAQTPALKEFEILITGGNDKLEEEYLPYMKNIKYQVLHLSEEDLSLAYSAALALVYPSLYEGFGLPVLEAMQSACPVITSPNSSLLEIGDASCLFVQKDDIQGMVEALKAVKDINIRNRMIKAGLIAASKFSWVSSSQLLVEYITSISKLSDDKVL
jgi:glycosyltransferase involved in cell wall biosynthesis